LSAVFVIYCATLESEFPVQNEDAAKIFIDYLIPGHACVVC